MLYFSPNPLLTLHRINVLKKAKHRLLTCRHPGTQRVSLHLISEVRNSVALRMQWVNKAFQFYVFLKLDNINWLYLLNMRNTLKKNGLTDLCRINPGPRIDPFTSCAQIYVIEKCSYFYST